MTSNSQGLDVLIAQLRPIHNDICLMYHARLVRLVGVGEDDEDFYYVVREVYNPHIYGGASEHRASAVGHIMSLKQYIPEKEYERLDTVFQLNGAPKSDDFQVINYGN